MSKIYRVADCDETAEGPGNFPVKLFSLLVINKSSAIRHLKLYDTYTPVVGVTTPVMSIPIPHANAEGGGFNPIFKGIDFDNAMMIACTTGSADNDVGAPDAGDVVVHAEYGRLINGSLSE